MVHVASVFRSVWADDGFRPVCGSSGRRPDADIGMYGRSAERHIPTVNGALVIGTPAREA